MAAAKGAAVTAMVLRTCRAGAALRLCTIKGMPNVNANCAETIDLLARALRLMDGEGLHHVAARIAMAIDDLSGHPACAERDAVN